MMSQIAATASVGSVPYNGRHSTARAARAPPAAAPDRTTAGRDSTRSRCRAGRSTSALTTLYFFSSRGRSSREQPNARLVDPDRTVLVAALDAGAPGTSVTPGHRARALRYDRSSSAARRRFPRPRQSSTARPSAACSSFILPLRPMPSTVSGSTMPKFLSWSIRCRSAASAHASAPPSAV